MKLTRIVKMADGSSNVMTYEQLCKDLGFSPEVKFVELTTAGTISWTRGKPCEIRALRASANAHGYKLSRNLSDF